MYLAIVVVVVVVIPVYSLYLDLLKLTAKITHIILFEKKGVSKLRPAVLHTKRTLHLHVLRMLLLFQPRIQDSISK